MFVLRSDLKEKYNLILILGDMLPMTTSTVSSFIAELRVKSLWVGQGEALHHTYTRITSLHSARDCAKER